MFTFFKKYKPQISIIFTLLFIGYLIFYFFDHQDEFSQLLSIRFIDLLLISGLQVFTLFLNGLFIQKVLIPYHVSLKTKESFKLSVMSSFGNYFTPFQGGMGVRAVYLKRNHGLSYSKFLSTLYGNYLIVFAFQSFVGLLSLFFIYLSNQTFFLFSTIIFISIFLGTTFFMFFPTKYLQIFMKRSDGALGSIANVLFKVLDGWSFIRKHKKLLIWLVSLTVLNAIAAILITNIALLGLGIRLNLFQLALYGAISSLSLLISITPGSIGIKEGVLILFQEVIGLSQGEVLQSSVLIRSSMFFILLVLTVLIYVHQKTSLLKRE